MLSKKAHLICATFCSLAFFGCASTAIKSSDPTQAPVLEPASLLKFNDIPMPSNFALMPDESYNFQASGFRAGLLKYKGKASGEQIVVFFKEQMPLYNWYLVNIIEHGRQMLSFDKEQEACIITIDEKGANSEITVSIAPKSHPSYRKTEKPIKQYK